MNYLQDLYRVWKTHQSQAIKSIMQGNLHEMRQANLSYYQQLVTVNQDLLKRFLDRQEKNNWMKHLRTSALVLSGVFLVGQPNFASSLREELGIKKYRSSQTKYKAALQSKKIETAKTLDEHLNPLKALTPQQRARLFEINGTTVENDLLKSLKEIAERGKNYAKLRTKYRGMPPTIDTLTTFILLKDDDYRKENLPYLIPLFEKEYHTRYRIVKKQDQLLRELMTRLDDTLDSDVAIKKYLQSLYMHGKYDAYAMKWTKFKHVLESQNKALLGLSFRNQNHSGKGVTLIVYEKDVEENHGTDMIKTVKHAVTHKNVGIHRTQGLAPDATIKAWNYQDLLEQIGEGKTTLFKSKGLPIVVNASHSAGEEILAVFKQDEKGKVHFTFPTSKIPPRLKLSLNVVEGVLDLSLKSSEISIPVLKTSEILSSSFAEFPIIDAYLKSQYWTPESPLPPLLQKIYLDAQQYALEDTLFLKEMLEGSDILLFRSAGNEGLTMIKGNKPGLKKVMESHQELLDHTLLVGDWDISKSAISSYSNQAGDYSDMFLLAPGKYQIRDVGDNIYEFIPKGGTSTASAIASAIATKLRGAFPDLTYSEIKEALLKGANKDDIKDYNPNIHGQGIINFKGAMAEAHKIRAQKMLIQQS